MRRHLALLALLALPLVACTVPPLQGGSNANDRSNGGEQGEELATGAMVVSPYGKYALMQRNSTSVLLDIEAKTAREMPAQLGRFIFVSSGDVGLGFDEAKGEIVAYDLKTAKPSWTAHPELKSSLSFARLSDDGAHLLLGDTDRVLVLDAKSGKTRGEVSVGSWPAELSFVPGTSRALVVGTTRWADHKPLTDVVDVDLTTLASSHIDVPNCTAPIQVVPDGKRAFLSPTFCEEGQQSTGKQTWTNPDPVSVIDLGKEGPHFVENLPGFGPVAMDSAGKHIVAYLDTNRMDPSMFKDPSQVPPTSGPRYHIMTIDPGSLAFELSPIGDVLPRFAMAKSGKQLLVDATVQQVRGEAKLKASIDASGKVTVSASLFGKSGAPFGLFDLEARSYQPFSGATASLDRFVQIADGETVFGLTMSLDGLGGDLYRIDLASGAVTSLGKSLRDIGLLPDGKTLLLRERLPAAQTQTDAGISWYRREKYSLSVDGVSISWSLEFQDSTPFQTGPACTESHDC